MHCPLLSSPHRASPLLSSPLPSQWQSEAVTFVIGAVQLGFLGSLSTVSTLMAEVLALHASHASRHRSYLYLFGFTILPSFLLGLLLYCVPVWTHGYESKYNHL